MNIWNIPSITTESIDGYAGYAFTGQLELNQNVTAKWTAIDKLPSGLSLNASTGAITGRPSKAGEYDIAFKATTSLGDSEKTVKIVIYEKPTKPVFKTSSLKQGVVGETYKQEIDITGTFVIYLSWKGLPSGLSFDIQNNKLHVS